jgi:tRNA threonylcarbamoyladenosine biosynthesis protein TsaB
VARFREEFGGLEHAEVAGSEFAAPSVDALVALATARAEREEFELPAELRPLYLRQSDAEIAWGDRAAAG